MGLFTIAFQKQRKCLTDLLNRVMEIRQAINLYLTAKAYKDEEFKKKFENPAKNLDECVAYITYRMYEKAKAQAEQEKETGDKSAKVGCVIPSDDEVFALAEQYYTDEDLKVENWHFFDAKLVSISATTFTDEEKQKMREEAIKKYQDDVIAEQRKKDNERKNKAKASKEKKPAAPVIVPDTTEDGEKPAEKEEKPKAQAVQMDIFAGF